MRIPKRIILTGQSIYLRQQSAVDCLRRFEELHPDWEVVFYGAKDAKEFMAARWPAMMPVWEDFEWIDHRNTLVALMTALEFGGFYFHSSMYLDRGLDGLRENALVLAQSGEFSVEEFAETYGEAATSEKQRWTVTVDGFGAEPGHWFTKAALENFISVAQEQEALRTGLDSGRQEPTFLSMTYAANAAKFTKSELLLKRPPEALMSAFRRWSRWARRNGRSQRVKSSLLFPCRNAARGSE